MRRSLIAGATATGMREPSELHAFQVSLADEVRAVISRLKVGETYQSIDSFSAVVHHETLQIPARLYCPAKQIENQTGYFRMQIKIAACLGTRHHDGFVRERCLVRLLPATEPWVVPYVVALVGEYVLPIIRVIQQEISASDLQPYGEFLARNGSLFETIERRVISYWNAYYRRAFPHWNDYPGADVLKRLHLSYNGITK